MSEQDNIPLVDENHVIAERREKLTALRVATNGVAFPNDFKPKHKAAALQVQYGEFDKETPLVATRKAVSFSRRSAMT